MPCLYEHGEYQAFKKSVGLNGVGSKAVMLSEKFIVQSFREGQSRRQV